MRLTENFIDNEFYCPCCRKQEMTEEFLLQLQILRTKCNFPFKINSGWRCETHNAKVSSSSRNQHTAGCAVDVSVKDRYKRETFIKYVLESGYFKDIAVDKTFIHLGKGNKNQGMGVY